MLIEIQQNSSESIEIIINTPIILKTCFSNISLASDNLRPLNKLQMNFCYNSKQKQANMETLCNHHTSHHCIHSHSCTHKDHSKKQQKQNKQSHKRIESQKGIAQIQKIFNKQESHNCQFERKLKNQRQAKKNQKVEQLLLQRQQEIKQLSKKFSDLQIKLRKDSQQNSDLNSQLHYYRQQFANLIQCSSVDSKKQIKKRLEETANLKIKIKSTQAKNKDLLMQNKQLKNERDELQQKCQRLKSNYEKIVCQNQELSLKIRQSLVNKQANNGDRQKRQQQAKTNQENYKIIISELKKDCHNLYQKKKNMASELQSLKMSKRIQQNKFKNEVEINTIKMNQLMREIQALRILNGQIQREKGRLDKDLEQYIQKNDMLQQEIKHARRLIQVHTTALGREQQKQGQGKGRLLRQINKEESGKQNQPSSGKVTVEQEALRRQIVILKQQIQNFKSDSVRNLQEAVLKIGISEAFKRIMDEKNLVIKQLMRQKAQIKSTAILESKFNR